MTNIPLLEILDKYEEKLVAFMDACIPELIDLYNPTHDQTLTEDIVFGVCVTTFRQTLPYVCAVTKKSHFMSACETIYDFEVKRSRDAVNAAKAAIDDVLKQDRTDEFKNYES